MLCQLKAPLYTAAVEGEDEDEADAVTAEEEEMEDDVAKRREAVWLGGIVEATPRCAIVRVCVGNGNVVGAVMRLARRPKFVLLTIRGD
jgi:hypothetical protein